MSNTLSDFQNKAFIKEILESAGLHQPSINSKIKLFRKSAEKLNEAGINDQITAKGYFVPGRLEVLGKHTDYAGGSSIVAAVDRGFCLVFTEREDSKVRIFNVLDNEKVELPLNCDIETESEHWSHYPATVIKRVVRNFGNGLHGCDIAFASDLPVAAGMSSSSAMVISIFMAIATSNQLFQTNKYKNNIKNNIDLSQYMACIENGRTFNGLDGSKGVGTFGGSEDHTAILNCEADYLTQFSYCPIKNQQKMKVPEQYVFVIANSGVNAKKTGTAMDKYNKASILTQKINDLWNKKTNFNDNNLFDALNRSEGSLDRLKKYILDYKNNKYSSQNLLDRLEQFYKENFQIIPKSIEAISNDNLDKFGKLVDRSQVLTTYKLKNQVPETEYLSREARRLGAVAASAFGAGFGGSVWILVKKNTAKKFIQKLSTNYSILYPESSESANYFIANAGPAAFDL